MPKRGVAILVLAVLFAASCGNASNKASNNNNTPGSTGSATTVNSSQLTVNHPVTAPGVSSKEIRVGVLASITNPLGANYGAIADGVNAYFAMVNSTNGGLYGRTLKVAKVRDDNLSQNQQQAQAMVSQDNVFAVFVAALLFTGSQTLAQANVPTFGWNINREWTGPTNFFPNNGSICFGCAGPGLPALAQRIGAKKVGILAYNVQQSADCLKGDLASFKKFPTAQVVFQDSSIGFGVTDLSAQVANMKKAGVQFITTCMDINGVFTLAKEMATQGLHAVQQLPQGYDQRFMAANGKFFEGDYIIPQFTAFEHTPQPPLMQKYFQWMNTIHKSTSELSMQGWIAADQFVTGLKLAGPDFSREKVIQSLNGLTHYDADGLIQPIDWTKQHRDPAKDISARGDLDCANTVQVKSSKFVSVFGEPGKPWVCFKSADENPASNAPMAVPTPTNYSFVDNNQG
jgi:ABC-type branched-subunit amino acid transport system substrate-binding protein